MSEFKLHRHNLDISYIETYIQPTCLGQWKMSDQSAQPLNPFIPNGAFNICCPRDCVSRHNGGTRGAPLKPLRVDSALRALSTLRGLRGGTRGSPIMPRDAVSRTANVERTARH